MARSTSAWSKPTPACRSASARHCAAVGNAASAGASSTRKSLPRPCILVNSMRMRRSRACQRSANAEIACCHSDFGRRCDDTLARLTGQWIAVPVADAAAGAEHDGHQSLEIVRFQRGLDHQVAMPGGQQSVDVAIAAVAPKLHAPRAVLVAPQLIAAKAIGRGAVDARLLPAPCRRWCARPRR